MDDKWLMNIHINGFDIIDGWLIDIYGWWMVDEWPKFIDGELRLNEDG